MTMIRKHAALLVVAAAFLVGCQDSRLPTDTEPGILPQISDGADRDNDGNPDGNPHFFFLPPMVPNPDIPLTETFNPALTPQVFICEFSQGMVPTLTAADEVFCSGGGRIGGEDARSLGPFDAPRVEGLEHYIFHWQTVDFGLHTVSPDNSSAEVFYRVFVVAAGEEVGFADVDVAATSEEMKAIDEALFVPLFIDRTLPVKFFVGTGFICAARGLTECGDGFSDFANGEDDVITLNNSGVSIPDQPQTQEFQVGAITLIVTPCSNPDNLPTDLPRFGPCFDIETFPELTNPLPVEATVFTCDLIPITGLKAKDADLTGNFQLGVLTMHRWDDDATGPVKIQALPHADAPCETIVVTSNQGSGLMRFARSGWNAVTNMAAALFAPEALYAKRRRRGDFGPGGLVGSFSRYQIMLPATMSKDAATDNQVADAGSNITVRVLFDDPVLPTPGPVAGARVRCTVTSALGGSVTPVDAAPKAEDAGKGISDADGAEFTWTLGSPGPQTLGCSGFGIADPTHTGPFMPPIVDADGDPIPIADRLLQDPVDLKLGTVTFDAFVCNNFDITANGSLSESEWSTASPHEFTANLSKGNKAPATVKVMNDCTNLYVALTVERPEPDDVNVLRVDFDNDGDGAPAEGDDVWKLEAIANADPVVTDGFLTSRCFRGGKQAECFTEDTDAGGLNNVDAGHGFAGGSSVYEFKHSLSTGDTRSSDGLSIDIDLDRDGFTFGMFFTLSQSPSAKGAQGNTQWPGFRLYLQCTTATPTASGSQLSCTVPQER